MNFKTGETYRIGPFAYTVTETRESNQGHPVAIAKRTDGAPLDAINRWALVLEYGSFGGVKVQKA